MRARRDPLTFNRRDSKTRLEKPREEWIEVEVPAIVGASFFAAAQEKLDAFQPMKTARRIATSTVLLAGIAKLYKRRQRPLHRRAHRPR